MYERLTEKDYRALLVGAKMRYRDNYEMTEALNAAITLFDAKADGRLVEVTQGRWLPHTNVTAKCSTCDGLYSPYKYCPNCGARMSCETAEKAIVEVGE